MRVVVLDDDVLASGEQVVGVEIVLDVQPKQVPVGDHQFHTVAVSCDVLHRERPCLESK